MMTHFVMPFLLSLLYYYSLLCTSEAVFSSSAHHLCHPHEALSLLHFKKEMLHLNSSYASSYCDEYSSQYSYPKMISWNKTSSDCCTWDGITCHKITGHVIGLDLSCSKLAGVIHDNSTLFRLSHLRKLNLASNDFSSSEISPNFGELSSLTHVNLSSSYFNGTIPSKLSHLSKLVLLDLKYNNDLSFSHGDFQILLRNLTHIRVLSLWGVNISDTLPANWSSSLAYLDLTGTGTRGKLSNSIFHLPRLQNLLLSGNANLSVSLPKSNSSNTSPLQVLDLSFTKFSSSDGFPDSISSFPFLRSLKLVDCGLSGSFPNSIGNLSQIALLDLSHNNFTGNIPSAVSNLPKLEGLFLDRNSFVGQFPSHLGNLTELSLLRLDSNFLSGPLPSNMSGLPKLASLSLSNNAFEGRIPSSLFSLPLLTEVFLRDNNFTGQIKEFTSKSLEYIDLSSNNLNVSNKFTNVSFPNLYYLGLSSCEMTEFPSFLNNSKNLYYLDLSSNKLGGQIPYSMPWNSLSYLNLSHNSLSSLGSLNTPHVNKLEVLDLRSNNFHGQLPLSVCSFEYLSVLDVSHNNFTGTIPECLGSFSISLQVLNLAKNELKGAISVIFPKGNSLQIMSLNDNFLEGPLRASFANCTKLQVLDLGKNVINDTFPIFLENLVELQALILKSNRFSGSISNFNKKNFLPKLQIFDLSCNEFTGALPVQLLKSFKAMATSDKIQPKARYIGIDGTSYRSNPYYYSVSLAMKGQEIEFPRILIKTFVFIDLSSNNFTGEIPEIIGSLNSLRVLKLSHNKFAGPIPSALGKLHFLESLDLSWNQLEGVIPQNLADLTSLGFLNLSVNRLVGSIPQGKQFQTFLNDSYYGNLGLCGFPVSKGCGEMDQPSTRSRGSHQDDDKDSSFWNGFTWKPVLIGYSFGIVFGFGIGCCLFFTGCPKWLARDIEEGCWYGLLLIGNKAMRKRLKKSRRRGWNDIGRNN